MWSPRAVIVLVLAVASAAHPQQFDIKQKPLVPTEPKPISPLPPGEDFVLHEGESVTMSVTLVERATGKVLYTRPNLDIRERYQIATDPALYYEESEDALRRASREVARAVVTDILQSF